MRRTLFLASGTCLAAVAGLTALPRLDRPDARRPAQT